MLLLLAFLGTMTVAGYVVHRLMPFAIDDPRRAIEPTQINSEHLDTLRELDREFPAALALPPVTEIFSPISDATVADHVFQKRGFQHRVLGRYGFNLGDFEWVHPDGRRITRAQIELHGWVQCLENSVAKRATPGLDSPEFCQRQLPASSRCDACTRQPGECSCQRQLPPRPKPTPTPGPGMLASR